MHPTVEQDRSEERGGHRRQPENETAGRSLSRSATAPAALAAQIRDAHAFRLAIAGELNTVCVRPDDMQCSGCAMAAGCDRMLSSLTIKLLNAVVEQVRDELALINQYRHDPRHGRALAEHVASHAKLINDLSAYVMDWGRILPGDLINVTVALLKYWNDTHFRFHDEALLDIATGAMRTS